MRVMLEILGTMGKGALRGLRKEQLRLIRERLPGIVRLCSAVRNTRRLTGVGRTNLVMTY